MDNVVTSNNSDRPPACFMVDGRRRPPLPLQEPRDFDPKLYFKNALSFKLFPKFLPHLEPESGVAAQERER